jgi:hypothetical protein
MALSFIKCKDLLRFLFYPFCHETQQEKTKKWWCLSKNGMLGAAFHFLKHPQKNRGKHTVDNIPSNYTKTFGGLCNLVPLLDNGSLLFLLFDFEWWVDPLHVPTSKASVIFYCNPLLVVDNHGSSYWYLNFHHLATSALM